MKLYIRKNIVNPGEVVLGMATSRSELMKDLIDRNPVLIEHVVKFYVYPDKDSQNHWKQEIAGYLDYVNRKTLKGGKKLKSSDLKRTIFRGINDGDISDAHSILRAFILDIARPESYPIFKITHKLENSFSKFLNLFLDNLLPILTRKNDYSMEDFYPILDQCVRLSHRPEIEYIDD